MFEQVPKPGHTHTHPEINPSKKSYAEDLSTRLPTSLIGSAQIRLPPWVDRAGARRAGYQSLSALHLFFGSQATQRRRLVSSFHRNLIRNPTAPKMSLTNAEKAAVLSLWAKVSFNLETLGAEVLQRLFASYPQTIACFSQFDDSCGSADLQQHGAKLLATIGEAAAHLDNFDQVLSKVSDLHDYYLKVDPTNFKLLSHTIQTVLASHFPEEFTPATHAAWDKYLAAVSAALTSKYG